MFEAFLKQHDRAAWTRTLDTLLPSIHEVDRNATRIWFHFFPLALADAFAQAENPARLAIELRLDGDYLLAGQCDTSHWFLYGHRYWPQTKAAIIALAESSASPSSLELATIIRDLAKAIAAAVSADESLVLGITAVGLMTLRQVGLAELRRTSGEVTIAPALAGKSPAQILAARKKDDSQGLQGLFRGKDEARYTVTFDERDRRARFQAIVSQQITTAAANYDGGHSYGNRYCQDGPIPVECRTASCGTCWIGVVAGAEKLSEVDEHEARRMKEFGYIDAGEPRPLIRLACMAMASGNVTIVVPPWNGFTGKVVLDESS